MTSIPKLVLLPGLDGSSALFEPLLAEYAHEAQTVPFPPTESMGYADLVPFVVAALPRDRDFVLLGWSFAGPLALMVAAQRPPGLVGVVLCATFVTKPVAYVPRAAAAITRPFLFHKFARITAAKALIGGYGTPEIRERIMRAHSPVAPAVMARRVRETLRVDAREQLSACTVPLLYLAATHDHVVPHRNLRLIQKLRPDLEVRMVAGPHLALATNPVSSARELERFVCDRANDDQTCASSGEG